MISVYVASRFQHQVEARRLRAALAERGIGCTSRWLEEETQLGKNLPDDDLLKVKFAAMDLYDVRRAQAVVLWNPADSHKVGTGGCHTEVGAALGVGMPVFVVGYDPKDPLPVISSNIFHFMPQVRCFTWPNHLDALVEKLREVCPDFGPTWDSPEDQARKNRLYCDHPGEECSA